MYLTPHALLALVVFFMGCFVVFLLATAKVLAAAFFAMVALPSAWLWIVLVEVSF